MRPSRQIRPVAIRTLNAEKMPTIASSEQEAAFTLVLPLETASRCLLSLTQAFADSIAPSFRLRVHTSPGNVPFMTRQQVESAVASRVPFSLFMADGREYRVPHPDYISLPPKAAYVIVYDDEGHFTVLPLLTMTGLKSTITDASAKEK